MPFPHSFFLLVLSFVSFSFDRCSRSLSSSSSSSFSSFFSFLISFNFHPPHSSPTSLGQRILCSLDSLLHSLHSLLIFPLLLTIDHCLLSSPLSHCLQYPFYSIIPCSRS
ncbi:MAG: hypothetical protein BYD32DRAFT_425463 [Podila humilis]|nr:MAG: hypothetical protein BYD32DRAFT_425463 [Podila humilis]